MLSKTFIGAALAATVAWTASAAAMPLQGRDSSSSACNVYGISALGFNASGIEIYSNQPAALTMKYDASTKRLVTDYPDTQRYPAPKEQFIFNNCSYTPGPYQGKGAINTWQGFIQGVNEDTGELQCLTASALKTQNATLSLADCKLDASKPGGVDATQHFQWQEFSFDFFDNVLFLGESDGKSTEQQFQQGDQYHWSIDPSYRTLYTSYNPTPSDAKQNPSEYLIAQF